jgi:hypothetical protein
MVTTQSIATREPCDRFGKRRVVPCPLVGVAQDVVRIAQLAPGAVLIRPLERDTTVRGLDLLRGRVGTDAEDAVEVAHRPASGR